MDNILLYCKHLSGSLPSLASEGEKAFLLPHFLPLSLWPFPLASPPPSLAFRTLSTYPSYIYPFPLLCSPFTSYLPKARPPFIHLPQPLARRAFYLSPHVSMFNPFSPSLTIRPHPSLPSSPSFRPSFSFVLSWPPSEDIKRSARVRPQKMSLPHWEYKAGCFLTSRLTRKKRLICL